MPELGKADYFILFFSFSLHIYYITCHSTILSVKLRVH